jgi:hypothetical protein
MTKRYTLLHLILPIALFVIPSLLYANGEPIGNMSTGEPIGNPILVEPIGNPQTGKPATPDSLALAMGHCNPITVAVVNCATKTIELSAYVSWLFTGVLEPWVATWSNGVTAHKITITPADLPGTWNWDASGTGCEQNHWNTDYAQPGNFFLGVVDIQGQPLCDNGFVYLNVTTEPYPDYEFPNFSWNPSNGSNQLTPFEVTQPGIYTLNLTDQLGCPFTDQINIPNSPPVLPLLSGPQYMCPEGDTGMIQTVLPWGDYEWSTGDTTQSIIVTEPGLYDVTVTNQFGCTGQGVYAVQNAEVSPFNISITAATICVGQKDTLRVLGGFSQYHWSNGTFGITNIVTQPGTYTVTVTNSTGCTGTNSVTVGLTPTPTIAITSTPFCPGASSTLTVTGGNFPGYVWSGGQTTNPITVSASGTYTVTVSGATICATSTSVSITQSPAPTTFISPPAQLNCAAPSTVLDATTSSSGPGFSFVWSTIGGNISANPNTLNPTVNAAGVYTLQITNTTTGCTASTSVTVTSDMQAPPAPAGNPATLTCSVTNLNIGPALPPTDTTLLPNWVASGGGFIVSGQNTWNPNINEPGTYTLTVTNPANSCTSTASVVIPENVALPNSLIAPPSQLTCTMNNVALNGAGSSSGPNFNYLWTASNGGTISGNTNTAVSEAASVGIYTLLVTNTANGCTATSSVTVTADVNIPVTGVQPPATLTCDVTTVTIDASVSSSGPTFVYTWTGPSPGSITSGQGTLTPTVNAPGTYTLQLVNNANSCSATLSVVVPQDIVPPVANAGQNATLNCVIPTLVLDGTASSMGANFQYQWSTTNGTIVSGGSTLSPTVSMAGTYTLMVTNLTNGCTSVSSVQVMNDASAPIAVIANPATLTCTTLQTIIDGLGSSQGATYTYNWTGPTPTSILSGQTTLQPTVNAPGVYTLDIVNTANGCTDTDTITVPQDIVAPVALAGTDELINCTTPTETIGSASNPSGANFTLVWSTIGGNFISGTNGPTASINAPGTYTLLITNNTNGCTDTDDVVVTDDFVAPIIDAGPTVELNCVQTSTVLQGTGSTGPNFLYVWTPSNGGNIVSGGNTLTPTVNTDGTYDVLVTNQQNGCTSTDQVIITQSDDVPDAVIAQPNILTCTLTSFNLNAVGTDVSPSISYTWTASNGGNVASGGTTLTPTIDNPGTYVLQVFDASNNCTATETIVVQENIQNPVVNAGNPATLTCEVLTLPLEATIQSSSSTNLSYVWSASPGGIINGGGNTSTPTIGATGTYTVLVTDVINGCTGTSSVQIVADVAQPNAVIAPPATLTCVLEETQINGTASSQGSEFEYLWTTIDGTIVSGGTSNQPTVNDPGTYNLLVTNTNNGCTQTASIVVPEDVVLPVANAGPSVGLDCDTQTNALDGNGSSQGANFVYTWTTNGGQIISGANTLTPQIGDPGPYTLTVENTVNGCVTVSNVTVTEDVVLPSFVIGPPQLLTCVTTSTVLQASGSDFGNAPTYTWTTNTGNIVSGGNTLNATVNDPGLYTLTIVNTVNGCTSTEEMQVLENVAPPAVNTPPVGLLTCTVLDQTLLANAPAQAVLQWTASNGGNIVSGANSANPLVNQPGTYTVLATLPLNGCTASASVDVNQELNIPTSLLFSLDPPLCNGTLGTLAILQINGGVGPYVYSIDGGDTFFPAQEIGGLEPGSYDLVIQDANGCEVEDIVPVPEPPTPAIALPSSFEILLGENQELQAVIPPSFPLALIDQVIWTPLDGLTFQGSSIQELLNPTAMPFVTTDYSVTIITKEGCKADSRTIIRVDRDIDIYAPNVIWPDDPDSDNNAFTLFTRQGSVNQILSLQVYDRWGEQLFVNRNFLPDDASLGWPGDFKGEPVNPGVFVWWAEVELIDGQKILMKGDVTVVK